MAQAKRLRMVSGWSPARRQSRSTRGLARAVPEATAPRARVAAGLLPGVRAWRPRCWAWGLAGQTLDPTPDRRVVAALPAAGLDPAKIPPDDAVALRLASQLVPCHRCEQLEQLLGRLQLVLPQGGADEEAGSTDSQCPSSRAAGSAGCPPAGRTARRIAGSYSPPTPPPPAVPGPNATQQHLEAFISRGRIPHRCRDLRFPTRSSRAVGRTEPSTSDYGDHRPCCETQF